MEKPMPTIPAVACAVPSTLFAKLSLFYKASKGNLKSQPTKSTTSKHAIW